MSSLLPPNSTPLEFALEATSAHAIDNIAVDLIRTLKDPHKIPAHLLPALAWELSVDYWDDAWPEERQREVCARSLELHRKKGTLEAIRLMLSLAGVQAEMARSDTPYAFDATLPAPQPEGLALTDELYQRVHQMIDVARPTRSPYNLAVRVDAPPAGIATAKTARLVTHERIDSRAGTAIKAGQAGIATAKTARLVTHERIDSRTGAEIKAGQAGVGQAQTARLVTHGRIDSHADTHIQVNALLMRAASGTAAKIIIHMRLG